MIDSNEPHDQPVVDPVRATITAKLRCIVDGLPAEPPWREAWLRLRRESTEEEWLALYQAIRDSNVLPAEAGFYLVFREMDEIVAQDSEDALQEYELRLHAIEDAYGLSEGGIWPSGAAPAGYDELREQYYRAYDTFFAQELDRFGEHEMATLFRTDRERFKQISEAGRQYFFGSKLENHVSVFWVREMLRAVAACMIADSAMGPLAYRYVEEDGLWHVIVYATPVELIGGAVDGEIVAPGLSLDLEALRAIFDRIDDFSWQTLGFPGGSGPDVSLAGIYQGRELFLQVLAYAPEDEEPGMKLDTLRLDH